METRQMTPFFLIFLFVTLISEFENTKNSFSCGPSWVHSGL